MMTENRRKGFGFGKGLPGHNLTANNRLTRMLGRGKSNNGTTAGGLGHVLERALLGYISGKENDAAAKSKSDELAAMSAMTQGFQPTEGTPQGGHPGMMDVPAQPGNPGGYEGGITALQGLQGNEFAGRYANNLMMKKFDADQSAAAAATARTQDLEDYETKKGIDQQYSTPKGPMSVSPGSTLVEPTTGQPIFSAPPAPKDRRIVTGPDKQNYYEDDGSLVLPNVEASEPQPFSGNSMDAQARNILLTQDPSSPTYAAAFSYLSEAKNTIDPKTGGITTITPDMSAFAPPALQQSEVTPVQGALLPDASTNLGSAPRTVNVPGSTVTRTEPPKPIDQKEIDDAEYSIKLVDDLLSHPGMQDVVGVPESISGATTKIFDAPISGTDAAGFTARLDQLGGRQFLEAYSQLKGGGQITEIEGKQATNALSRLQQTGQSETEYKAAALELQTILKRGLVRAGGGQSEAPQRRKVIRNPQTGKLEMMPESMPQGISNPMAGQGSPYIRSR